MPMQSRLLLTAAACLAGTLVMADSAPGQAYVLFAPGTDPAYQEQVLRQIEARNARLGVDRYSATSRWPGTDGEPLLVTWSFVPDGTGLIPSPEPPKPGSAAPPANSDLFFRLDGMFGSRAFWVGLIQDAFEVDPTGIEDIESMGTLHSWGNISGLSFVQIVAPPDVSDPENPIFFDWDSGATWDETGSANGPLSPGGGLPSDPNVGDIRIAGKKVDGFGGIVGYVYPPNDPEFPGEIVIDTQEQWAVPDFRFRFFRNAMAHFIGFSLGLEFVCPESLTKLMEPFDTRFGFTGPQHDDIRGIQALYGDYLENDDDAPNATQLPFSAGESLFGVRFLHDNRSLDDATDIDYYTINFPGEPGTPIDFDLTVRISPIGESYESGAITDTGCGAATIEQINSRSIRDLRISLVDAELNVVDVFDCSNPGQPLPRDALGFVDETAIGSPECFFTNITEPGDYFIIVANDGALMADQSQLYSAEVSIGNRIFNDGLSFDNLVLAPAPAGLGVGPIVNLPPGTTPEGQEIFRGSRARVGITEDRWPSTGHAATVFLPGPPPLPSQDFPPQRIAWPGNATLPPALAGVSSHATAAIACAVGNPLGTSGEGFVGPAFEAPWLAASIGIRSTGVGFTVSREALLYGLFGLCDPDTALSLGLPDTATVLTNSWGGSGDLRGDSFIAQSFDAAVFMTGVPSVVSAGNSGDIDNTPQCEGLGGNAPGGTFRGSRTLGSPSTSLNTISVGMAGKFFDIENPVPPLPEFVNPFFDPYRLVVDESSKGPADSFDFENGTTSFNVRPGIDLISIGSGYALEDTNPLEQDPPAELCSYTGHSSIIFLSLPTILPFEPDPDHPVEAEAFNATFGTSFAAPAVAGGIALLQDFALAQDPPFKLHPTVIRAILLTAARKFEGWSNNGAPAQPQDNRDGRDPLENDDVVNRQTTQGLDYAQGAGFADIGRSFEILKGRYSNPAFDHMVIGAPTTDVAITDPTKPTIFTPPNEIELIRPIPASSERGSEPESIEDLPKSPIEIARIIAESRAGMPDQPVFFPHADFGDPDIGRVGGTKTADGVSFQDRVPFKLPPSPNRPGIPPSVPPVEIDPELDRIIVNPIGWDHANLGQRVLRMPARGNFQGGAVPGGYIDYFIAYAFDGVGDQLSATLTWLREIEMDVPDFSNIDNPRIGEIERLELENLDLELIQVDALGRVLDDHVFLGVIGADDFGQIWSFSRSTFNTVEHIFTKSVGVADADDDEIIPIGFYVLRVRWINANGFTGQEYDLFNNSPAAVTEYGLAWRVEPTGGTDPTSRTASRSHLPRDQRLRVFQMFVDAFGTTENDLGFSPAFDVDRNGIVDIGDFAPIYNFWWNRR